MDKKKFPGYLRTGGQSQDEMERLSRGQREGELRTGGQSWDDMEQSIRREREAGLRTGKQAAEYNRARLAEARQASTPAGQAKLALKGAKIAISLMNYIDPFWDWIFGIALSFAILKDIVDLVGLGSLPVIGTLITFFASSIIFFALLLAGGGGKKKRWAKKYGILIAGTIIEFIFGIDFLPIETCVVIIVYGLTLMERRESEEDEQKQQAEIAQESFA